MASYDNSRYTYEKVLAGTGYYMKDDNGTYSSGVKKMQEKLNKAGYWCGTPDGKFGDNTDEAVRHFQRAKDLSVNGKANQSTLAKIDAVSAKSPGFTLTGNTYSIYFDNTNNRFMHNPQVVYKQLKNEGLRDYVIAGILGNIHAEREFRTAWNGHDGSVGICQWNAKRRDMLEAYANSVSKDKTSIGVQAAFILKECKSEPYIDNDAKKCLSYLKDSAKVKNVIEAADYFTALYERCECYKTWAQVQASSYENNRFSTTTNAYNQKYYLDTPKRRGYAQTYLNCIKKM